MNTINNERAMKKSKAQICSALMKLLKTEPYHKITVSQLCACAGISRTAFYKNFNSMDAVVLHKMVQIGKAYNRHRFSDEDIRSRFAEFYSFIKADRIFNLLVVQNNLFSLFEKQIKTSYLRYMAEQEGRTLKGFQREYLPEYLSATIVSLLRKWAETGYREPPELMADITARLLDGYQQLLPLPTLSDVHENIQNGSAASSEPPTGLPDNFADILNNIPTGVCVLFMPDETHQRILFANTRQMRLTNPDMKAPEKTDPQQNALRTAYYENAFSGVHPDDLQIVLDTYRKNFHEKHFQVPQVRLKTSSGDYIWVATDITLRESLPDGKLFYASFRDISKEVQLRKELEVQRQKNAEKTLLDTIGHLPACSILYREEEDGTMVPERFSDEYLRFRGYPEDETPDVKDNGFLQTVHPEDRGSLLQSLKASNRTSGKGVYLLDRLLGLEAHERITEDALVQILEEASESSYQKGGRRVSLTEDISKQAVMGKIHDLEFPPEVKPRGRKKQAEYLYIDADEDHVALQYDQQKGDLKKARPMIVMPRLVYVYEGVEGEYEGSPRHVLVNPHYFGGLYEGDTGSLWKEADDYIRSHYEENALRKIYIHGDGASWSASKINISGSTNLICSALLLSPICFIICKRAMKCSSVIIVVQVVTILKFLSDNISCHAKDGMIH